MDTRYSELVESMPQLLERAGFRVAGKRADCGKCAGGSRRTVSFTHEVAHCHRCQWSGNRITLARELGLLSDPRTRQSLRREQEQRERIEGRIRAFGAWRDEHLRFVTDRYRCLSRLAVTAEEVLKSYPTCEPAWCALNNFYHSEAKLVAQIERLSCTRVPQYLQNPYSITEVFDEWRAYGA
jgi:hypothetical protein